jgi:hypothetical protein
MKSGKGAKYKKRNAKKEPPSIAPKKKYRGQKGCCFKNSWLLHSKPNLLVIRRMLVA